MDERDLATYWNFVEGSVLMQATICNFLIDQGILDQAKLTEALDNALARLPSESMAMGAPFRLMLSNIDKHHRASA
jgi:hypothetical protein